MQEAMLVFCVSLPDKFVRSHSAVRRNDLSHFMRFCFLLKYIYIFKSMCSYLVGYIPKSLLVPSLPCTGSTKENVPSINI